GNHGLKRRRPLRDVSRPAPRVHDLPVLIELDDFGTANAAEDARRSAVAADLVALAGRAAIEEPDVIHLIDADAGDLLHAPAVGQRLRPERIDLEDRRAVLVGGLRRRALRVAGGRGG